MDKKYSISISRGSDGMYTGEILGLPAAYTQAPDMPTLMERLIEVSEGALSLNQIEKLPHMSLVVHA